MLELLFKTSYIRIEKSRDELYVHGKNQKDELLFDCEFV